jgi:glucosamine--fructose-6-phosphate aminotransferase (isomerizing)
VAYAALDAFKEMLHEPARAVPTSELLIFPDQVLVTNSERILPILISRSGYTSEVVRAARLLRERKIPFIAVTCEDMELSRLADLVFRLPVSEESTVMTGSFTSMLLTTQFIAARCARKLELIEILAQMPARVEVLLEESAQGLERLVARDFEDFVFLGQGGLFGIAQECAIKTTEASQSYVQAYHTLEFRHGPKAIVSPKVLTTVLISESGFEQESAVAMEVKELGGAVIAVANEGNSQLSNTADLTINLQIAGPEWMRAAAFVVWGQLIGVYRGLHNGLNPDEPHNLTRVVELEEFRNAKV